MLQHTSLLRWGITVSADAHVKYAAAPAGQLAGLLQCNSLLIAANEQLTLRDQSSRYSGVVHNARIVHESISRSRRV